MRNYWRMVAAFIFYAGHFVFAGEPVELHFEAEEVLVDAGALLKDENRKGFWTLWSKDPDGARKWSRGAVLRGVPVLADGEPAGLMPVLEFKIIPPADGVYDLFGRINRSVGISWDGGASWSRQSNGLIRSAIEIKNKTPIRFALAGNFAHPGRAGPPYIDYFTLKSHQPRAIPFDNADFESGPVGQEPPGWRFWRREAKADSRAELVAEGRSGEMAARVFANGKLDWAFANRRRIPVREGEGYAATVWVKNNVDVPAPDVALEAVGYKDGKVVKQSFASVPFGKLGGAWERRRLLLRIPAGFDQVGLRLVGEGDCDITVDDFSAMERCISPSPPCAIPSARCHPWKGGNA